MKLTRKEARLIIEDGNLKSLIDCTRDGRKDYPEAVDYFKRLEKAYRKLAKLVKKAASK